MKVARLTSLMVALDALGPRHRLDDEVEVVLPEPGRRPARLRPPPPRRVEAEHREERPLQRRLEGLRDRVHAEGEAVDPVAHRHVLRLRLEAHVGGALAGAEGQQVVEDAVGVALLPVDRGRLAAALGVGEPVDALRAQRRVHVLPAHEAPGDQDLAELPPRVPLLDERLEQLRGRDLLHPDEDVAQAVLALAEGLQLLDERRGACRQNSCLYSALASQKQWRQNGHSFVGFLGSSEHQTAPSASNSPRQFQQVTR